MALKPVKKVVAVTMRRDRGEVFERLQKAGCIHLEQIEYQQTLEQASESDRRRCARYEEELRDTQRALDHLATRAPKSSGGGFLKSAPQVEMDVLDQMWTDRSKYRGIVRGVEEILTDMGERRSREMRLNAQLDQLRAWEGLSIPVSALVPTRTANVIIGALPLDRFSALRVGAEGIAALCVEEVSRDSNTVYVFVAYHRGVQDNVELLLRGCGFTRIDLEGFEHSPAQQMQYLRQELLRAQSDYDVLMQRTSQLAEDSYGDLKLYYDALQINLDRNIQGLKSGYTTRTMMFTGWISAAREDEFRAVIADISQDVYLQISDPNPDEDAPVLVENSAIVAPFASVTRMYATPMRDEIDPSPVMSPFYFIFFGMMVSDAGYGVIIAVLCGLFWILKRGRTPPLIRLLTLGGISTVIWGALYGSWFGMEWFPPLLMNPMENSLTMLIMCFAMGYIHIMAGLVLKFYMNCRNGQVGAAFMDQGSWIVLLLSVVLFLVPGLSTVAIALLIASAVAIVATQGREYKSIFGKFGWGMYALYGATSYLSDILSYSRLFALGIATGVVALVINSICATMGAIGGVFGVLAYALVFTIGHVFNLGINGLGAYVHDARLQYVEFFGKFYEGGGREFAPFALRTKYNLISSEKK